MRNYRQEGEKFTFIAAAVIASGDFVRFTDLRGVAENAGGIGDTVTAKTQGVFELPKLAGATWTQGDTLYWDGVGKNFSKDNTKTAVRACAFADAASPDTIGLVYLY